MSASDKKKLRKEQNAAAITEKQQTEKKQQKKLKAYTLTFIIAMVLIVAIVLVATLQTPVKNLMMNNTTAVTVGEHKINAGEFNYYYVDSITNFYSQFSSYGDYQALYAQIMTGLNPAASVGSQVYNSETGETWADYFIDSAVESAKWTYTMYDKAMAEGFELSESDKTSLTSVESYMSLYATLNGYTSTDSYLKALYGSTANMETYMEYCEISTIANAYVNDYVGSLEYTDQDYRDHEADKYNEYSSFSYATFNILVNDYLTGGTSSTNDKGQTTLTYSDEEKEAARAAAEAVAKSLAEGEFTDIVGMNLSISKLEKYDKDDEATEATAVLYASVAQSNEDMKEWITSDERTAGEKSYFANTTTSNDKETVSSYTVVLYLDRIDNTMNVGTVRHLLVKFEGGTTDKTTNTTTYSDEEKAKAKAEAEKLLAQYKEGEMTEEAFIELVKKNSDDSSASSGGLFSDVTPDSGYVKPFSDWATAEHKPGDVDIIETEFGYHIMYYVEANELNYRDLLIKNDLMQADYEAWEEEVMKGVTATEGNMKYVNRDYTLTASN